MADFARSDGVKWYTHTTVDIYFPEGKVCCKLCPLMETYSRKQCLMTGEYIEDDRLTGYRCPLKAVEEPDGLLCDV